RPRKYPAVADLMADAVVLAIHAGGTGVRPCALCRDQREIDRAPGGYGSCHNKLDELPAIRAHFAPPSEVSSTSTPTSALPSARTRRRYQTTIVISENTKMMLDTALISGVMPRRRRPQISSGSVLSRPMRKKLTAISSIERVKISSAAPMIDSFKFGTVIRQNVCTYVAPKSSEA